MQAGYSRHAKLHSIADFVGDAENRKLEAAAMGELLEGTRRPSSSSPLCRRLCEKLEIKTLVEPRNYASMSNLFVISRSNISKQFIRHSQKRTHLMDEHSHVRGRLFV